MTTVLGRSLRLLLTGTLAWMVASCGSPTTPTPPPPPANSAPVVRSVTVSRTQVDAGQEIDVSAVAEDSETAAELLQYTWTAEPAGGTFTGQGRSVKWKAPTDGPVPGDYLMRVTVRDAGALTATGTSSGVRVNDGIREMQHLALTFLADFADVTKSPEYVVRNFSDSCGGKAEELRDVAGHRLDFSKVENVTPPVIKDVELNPSRGASICTYDPAKGGRAACALVIAGVDWRSTFSSTNNEGRTPGTTEHVFGDAWLTGVFEVREWKLCDSRFTPAPGSDLRQRWIR